MTDVTDYINEQAAQALDKREAEYGEETWSLVERAVLLRAIDTLWVEHLTELEDFRKGVGLRGYGGRDPLVEFKREAFSLYDELRGFIQHQVASTIFRVSVQQREAAPAQDAQAMPTLSPEQLAKLKSGGNGTPAARWIPALPRPPVPPRSRRPSRRVAAPPPPAARP